MNLLAVDAHTNRSKGDGDAATWLPPNKRFRCVYVARQVAVKRKYKLAVTAAEENAINRVLATCPGETLPSPGARIPVTLTHTQRTPAGTPGSGASGTGHVYANCSAARAAGVTPIQRGTPDYAANPQLDRDHDGVACEIAERRSGDLVNLYARAAACRSVNSSRGCCRRRPLVRERLPRASALGHGAMINAGNSCLTLQHPREASRMLSDRRAPAAPVTSGRGVKVAQAVADAQRDV